MPPPVAEDSADIELLVHDLRTALTVASMGIQLAMRRVAADEVPGQERAIAGLVASLAAINTAADSAQSLVDVLRDLRAGESPS